MNYRLLTALATVLAGSTLAFAQTPDLPPLPEIAPDPARDVTGPEPQGQAGPISMPAASGGFVLNGIEVEGNTVLPTSELSQIWSDLIGERVTLDTLNEIAARISAAYRERGYILSQAVVPAQTVTGGVVRLTVVEGFVDQVSITGGAPNQQRVARKVFVPVPQNRPLRLETLERGVLLSRDTFGSVYGGSVETVMEPSAGTFGAADMGVLITPEPFSGYVTTDNRGSRLYGDVSFGAGMRTYNLMGLNERLDFTAAYAPQDSSLAFGSVIFDAPLEPLYGTFLDGARLELRASASRGDPDLRESGTPDGLTNILNQQDVSARLIVPFVRTRTQNLHGRLGLSHSRSHSETRFGGAEVDERDRLTVLEARLTWDFADTAGGVNLIDGTLRQGLDIGNARVSGDGPAVGEPDFTSAQLTLSRLQSLGEGRWSLYGELMGQYAAEVLPNSERFYLGGSTIGRGFAPGNTSGDSGYGARLELRRYFDASTFGDKIRAAEVYGFADYGRAYDRSSSRDGDQWEELGSVGLGARLDVTDWLTITPEVARQTDGRATDTTDDDLETRFYLGAIARF